MYSIDTIERWIKIAPSGAELVIHEGPKDPDNLAQIDAGFARILEILRKAQDARQVYLQRDHNGRFIATSLNRTQLEANELTPIYVLGMNQLQRFLATAFHNDEIVVCEGCDIEVAAKNNADFATVYEFIKNDKRLSLQQHHHGHYIATFFKPSRYRQVDKSGLGIVEKDVWVEHGGMNGN